ncbi:hypothetical protein [Butyrivibrio proteoclasticus]|uniref:hypothetical protein n=1 Tax=Butyrivibrio proteoclasticus TaxID=43305 RepID=UPI0012DDA66B|nr:hypothetical protein [Butyrivibrio proteoclasticus]
MINGDCEMNFLINNFALLDPISPAKILDPNYIQTGNRDLDMATGIIPVEYILELIGYISGTVLIIVTLVSLMFLNYPRYVSDAKQKVSFYLISIGYISAYAFIGDLIMKLTLDAFFFSG